MVTLADTAAGYGCVASLPEGTDNCTTVERKSNHTGRTTQVWDAVVSHRETGRTNALFRCTRMILHPRNAV